MGRKNVIAAILAALGAILSAPALADTKAGVDAWTRGDFPTAVREWQASAAKGDADALFNLGQAYKLGKGVPQDLAKAEGLFGQAAAMGHLQASDNYGLLLFQRGEKARALPYIRAAADRGDPRAQYLLGIAHFNGDLVPKDWPRAYALLSLARQQGLPQAGPALLQMDEYVPLAERQQGVAMAGELQAQADATRARQMASVDLGTQVPAGSPAAPVPTKGPTMASAGDAVAAAGCVAGTDSPASAGADYTRRGAAPAPVAASASAPVKVRTTASPPVTAAPPKPAPAPAATGKWRIQLGAFGQLSNADALWNRIKARPEVSGHPRLNVKAGAVTKLQAGGFPSQAAAQAACAKLKAAGFDCVAISG